MKWLRRLLCRVRGHRWNRDPITFYKPDGVWLARSCQRCGRLTMQMLASNPGCASPGSVVDISDPEPWKIPDHGKN